ncbi:MAG: luxQ 5 [Rhodospirillales bacterium]|nr:luxQ 5 [Rhodospirillales bacterium]
MAFLRRVTSLLDGPPEAEPVRAEIVAALYPRSFRIGTSFVTSTTFGVIMMNMVGGPWPIVWTAGALLLCLMRTVDWWAYRKNPAAKAPRHWARGFTLRFLPFGFWWGASAAVFVISDDPLAMLAAVLAVEGMNAGSACSYAPHPPAAWAFVVPTSLLFLLAGIFYGGWFGFTVCAVEVLLGLNYLIIIRDFRRAYVGGIRLRYEREALVDRLAAANEAATREIRAKSEFLATLSHEIRTPMNAVLGAVQAIDDTGLPEQARSMLDVARRGGTRLAALIDDVLEFERLGAGPLPLVDTPFDPATLARDAAHLMRPLAEARGLTLDVICPAEPLPPLRGDPRRLEQIVLNLVSNSIRNSDAGRVEIEARCTPAADGMLLELEVRDDGPGIPDQVLARLFQPFAQGLRHGDGQAPESRIGGSGLGLAIAHRLAAAMGGKLFVDSGPRGSALRLALRLPVAATPPPPVPVATSDPPLGLNVLLVEDDDLSAVVVVAMLERMGCHATHVASGEAAIGMVADNAFDAVLMDMQLPGVDGLEAARVIRSRAMPPRLIAMTANATLAHAETYRREQLDGFVAKPLREDGLRRALLGGADAFGGAGQLPATLLDAALWRRLTRDFEAEGADHFRLQACDVITAYLADLATAGTHGDRAGTARAAHALAGAAGSSGLLALAGAAGALERDVADADAAPTALNDIAALGARSLEALGALRIIIPRESGDPGFSHT